MDSQTATIEAMNAAKSSCGKKKPNRSVQYINIERLRLFAAFGVVLFHMLSWDDVFFKSIGYAGLPIFLMVFSALLVIHAREISFKEYAGKRIYRLIIPWIFWSLVYAVVVLTKQYIKNHTFNVDFPANVWLVGASIHLWFLPYAFILSLLIFCLNRVIEKICTPLWLIVFTAILASSLFFFSFVVKNSALPAPLPQWCFGLPAVLTGIVYGMISRFRGAKEKYAAFALLLAVLYLSIFILHKAEMSALVVPYSIALPLVAAALLFVGSEDRISTALASLTFGIYLIHPLVGTMYHCVTHGRSDMFSVLCIFLVSGLITWAIQKTRLKIFV